MVTATKLEKDIKNTSTLLASYFLFVKPVAIYHVQVRNIKGMCNREGSLVMWQTAQPCI